jgi:hypothetical protein
MAKEQTYDDGVGVAEVQIEIVVEPGPIRATLTKLLASARVRAWLVSGGVIAAVAAGAIVAVWSSSGRTGRALDSGALATQFGLRSDCARRLVALPAGAYARIDIDHSGPCGAFGYQVTLVLHRIDGVWVREFQAPGWKCPIKRLPRPVVRMLGLCHPTVPSPRPVAPSPRGVP